MRAPITTLAGLILLPLAVQAEAPKSIPDRQPDTSPTGYSCTARTLATDEECVFESQAEPAKDPASQQIANVTIAQQIMETSCNQAARVGARVRPDESLLAICRKDAMNAVEACGIGGERPLLDDFGRFGERAQPCYLALSEVLQKVRFMASTSARCCACAAKGACFASAEQCNRSLTAPSFSLPACAAANCPAECSVFEQSVEGPPAQPPIQPQHGQPPPARYL